MTLPTGWPPRPSDGRRSIRFYKSGTGTANYADNAFIFAQQTGANPSEATPVVKPGSSETVNFNGTPHGSDAWSSSIRVYNDGSNDLTISFDGTNDHGVIKAGKEAFYWNRYEEGIAVKGVALFRIEAW